MVNAVAGVAATQALGWLLIGTTASVRHRQRWQSVIETIAGVFFLDALWQLVQVLPANLHLQDGLRRIDYADLLNLARIELGVSPILGKWVLTVAVAASLLGGFRALRRLR